MKRKAEKDADEGQTPLKGESPDEIKTVRLDGRCMECLECHQPLFETLRECKATAKDLVSQQ